MDVIGNKNGTQTAQRADFRRLKNKNQRASACICVRFIGSIVDAAYFR